MFTYFKMFRLVYYLLNTTTSFYTSADWLDVNMPVGVNDIRKEVFDLHMAIFFVTVAIGVVVFGFMFYSMWRYRRSNNKKPAKFKENHPDEAFNVEAIGGLECGKCHY